MGLPPVKFLGNPLIGVKEEQEFVQPLSILSEALSNWQTRLMQDKILTEWHHNPEDGPSLQMSCPLSGNGLNSGTVGWRYRIFKHHMPMVLQALRHGVRGKHRMSEIDFLCQKGAPGR
jgi:hypothetical protein